MKPIILDIHDMTDSREVYDSKPNVICTIFIYFILSMFLIALIWMYFGRIDVVVKSEGIIRPNNQVSTVKNGYSGYIEKVNIKDGDCIKKGDILYIIEHTELLTEKNNLERQIDDISKDIYLLEKYKKSVKEDKNYFEDNLEEEEFYTKFLSYYINYQTTEKGIHYSQEELGLNLEQTKRQLNDAIEEQSYILKLKKSIKENKNLFSKQGSGLEYYNIYEKYISEYKSLNLEYKKKKLEIDQSTTEEGVVNSIEYYNIKLEGLTTLQDSILQNMNQFTVNNSYSMQFENYRTKLVELEIDYKRAKEDYDINLELKGYGISDWEIEQSKIAMNKASNAISNYKNDYIADIKNEIAELKKALKDLNLTKDKTLTQDELYKNNEIEQKTAIRNFELKYITDLESKSNALSETIASLEDNKNSLELQDEKEFMYKEKDGTKNSGNLVSIKNSELQMTINSIKTLKNQLKDMETSLNKLNETIDKSIVTAKWDGIINSNVELVVGDMLAEGTEVLTIIPDNNSRYKVNIYVSNNDIGKMKEGMNIKCNIYALPNKEYGYLTGTITNISKDIKVNNSNSSGYYLVEAALDNKRLYDYNGKEANLKAGMGCQAQIITGNKSILTFILEKLDFVSS